MEPILEIRQLNSFYRQGGSAFSRGRTVQVLQDINVTIGPVSYTHLTLPTKLPV